MDVDNKKIYILVLVEGPKQGLDDTTITVEAEYPISFKRPERRFLLSLPYNERSSSLSVNAVKMYNFKAQGSKRKPYLVCLGNI